MADTEQQVTSKTPATKQKKTQNVSLRAKLSPRKRELLVKRRKRLSSRLRASLRKQNPRPMHKQKPPADPVADTPSAETTKNVLTTTQWLSIISIVVSVAGLYYKREEIKNLLVKKDDPQPRAPPPSPVLTRAPPVLREMD